MQETNLIQLLVLNSVQQTSLTQREREHGQLYYRTTVLDGGLLSLQAKLYFCILDDLSDLMISSVLSFLR